MKDHQIVKLGIIGAMDTEVALLIEKMTDKTVTTIGNMDFFCGHLFQTEVVICQSGVGKVNAAMCAQSMCDRFGVTHLVNTGVAGSLDNRLNIGDVVVSTDAIYHDVDATIFGYAPNQVPGVKTVSFPADQELIKLAFAASETLIPGHTWRGRVASGDQFIARQERKDQIIQSTGAMCTEMEGAAIAQTAYLNGVPFVILRAISDKADNSAQMAYPIFERKAAEHCAAVTEMLAQTLK